MDWIVFGIGAFIALVAYIMAIVIGERHNHRTSKCKSYCFDRDETDLF